MDPSVVSSVSTSADVFHESTFTGSLKMKVSCRVLGEPAIKSSSKGGDVSSTICEGGKDAVGGIGTTSFPLVSFTVKSSTLHVMLPVVTRSFKLSSVEVSSRKVMTVSWLVMAIILLAPPSGIGWYSIRSPPLVTRLSGSRSRVMPDRSIERGLIGSLNTRVTELVSRLSA